MSAFIITKRTSMLRISSNGMELEFSKQTEENGIGEIQSKRLCITVGDKYYSSLTTINADEIQELLNCLKYVDEHKDSFCDFVDITCLMDNNNLRIGARYINNQLWGICSRESKTIWFSFKEWYTQLVYMLNRALEFVKQ